MVQPCPVRCNACCEIDRPDSNPCATGSHLYASYPNPVYCGINGHVYFHWSASWHNLLKMASQAAYDSCDFTGAQTLVAVGSGVDGLAQYYLPCSTPGETIYLSCSVGTHCAEGQKVTVHVSSSQYAVDSSGATLIHVKSQARIMALMGYRVDPTTGFAYLDRGYQTETLASTTLDLVWCLEDHCTESPTSADDWISGASSALCKAEVNNLAGFIS